MPRSAITRLLFVLVLLLPAPLLAQDATANADDTASRPPDIQSDIEKRYADSLAYLRDLRERGQCSERDSFIRYFWVTAAQATGAGNPGALEEERFRAQLQTEANLPCPQPPGTEEPSLEVDNARDVIGGGMDSPGVDQALAELQTMVEACRSGSSGSGDLGLRYRRFYQQVRGEIDGFARLAQEATDPDVRRNNADRAVFIGVRLQPLPRPEDFPCIGQEQLTGGGSAIYGDPLWGLWQVEVERIRGATTQGRVAVWPNVTLHCVGEESTGCIYRWVVAPDGGYGVEGSATHMPYGHDGIIEGDIGSGVAILRHSYYPNTVVDEQLLLSADNSGMEGVWEENGETLGRSTWRRQPSRLTGIGFSDVTRDYNPTQQRRFSLSDQMWVEGFYDPFFWSANVTARLVRPKMMIYLYGDNFDGRHFVEFPYATGFEVEMSRPMTDGDRVIGQEVLVTIRPGVTPGRKLMRIDGQDYYLEVRIAGFLGDPVNDQ